MLSNTAKYAIKALHCISKHSDIRNKMTATEIAEITRIPKPFLSKLLKQLAQLDMISSSKGPNGGFYLSQIQLKQSVLKIITTIEGKDSFHMCILNFTSCNADRPCPIHHLISDEKDSLRNAIRKITLLDLSENLNYFAE
jgi:Rrf2 family transcriptional regulator, iron-sulfur cluster assembly transcription factor